VLIRKKSMITGQFHEMDLPVTLEQLARFHAGVLIQEVFPHLDAGQREFLLTGVTPQEWKEHVGDPDDMRLCSHCNEEFHFTDLEEETARQWRCPRCRNWNDKED
jgi:uncharacterized paraquat-inducible protein A